MTATMIGVEQPRDDQEQPRRLVHYRVEDPFVRGREGPRARQRDPSRRHFLGASDTLRPAVLPAAQGGPRRGAREGIVAFNEKRMALFAGR